MIYEDIDLEERLILNDKVKLLIPKELKEMPESLVSIKYSSAMRPALILLNECGSVDFKFNFLNQTTSEGLLDELCSRVKENIKKIYTSSVFFEDGSMVVDNKRIVWFDFSNNVTGGNVYNLMFYVIIDNNILNGSYSCLYNEAVIWRKIFLESIESIREVKGKKNE